VSFTVPDGTAQFCSRRFQPAGWIGGLNKPSVWMLRKASNIIRWWFMDVVQPSASSVNVFLIIEYNF